MNSTQRTDIGHIIGQDNIIVKGFDVHKTVFFVSASLIIFLVIATLLFREQAAESLPNMRVWITTKFNWFFIISCNFFVAFCLFAAFSKTGKVKLGGNDATPHHSYIAWLAMLFSAGLGIGLMFFGVYEPVQHTMTPPLLIDPNDIATARAAGTSAAIYHYGFQVWATYSIVALSLAFFTYNKGMPLTLRSAFYPLFGKAVWGPFGNLVDIVAIVATIFGLTTSLGYGAEQIAAGMQYLFGIEPTTMVKTVLIACIIGIAMFSVVAGLDKGIKRLSKVNISMALCLFVFVLLAGPTIYLLKAIVTGIIDYFYYLPQLSNWVGREDVDFYNGWTTFYWAWWIAWSPFVGMFIARISYGRTVRQFIMTVMLVPTLICILWMIVFGGTAMEQFFTDGYRGVVDSVPELALFKMLEQLPLTNLVSGISVILIAIFFITSADSGALVVDTISAGGKMDVPVRQRIFWCTLIGAVAIVLMMGGGLASLQALALSAGLPFCLVILIMCFGLYKGLRNEVT